MGNNTKKKGIALIMVLWMVALLGTITMLFSQRATMSLKINRNITNTGKAEALAEAAIYRVIADLIEDSELTTSDHLKETWSNNQEAYMDVQLGKGVYRVIHPTRSQTQATVEYGPLDECSKLNINTATRNALLQLPEATEELVDCVLDWRDDNDTPREFGAEDEYYGTLSEPYQAKNNMLDTVEELLLVKNMTPAILYGEDVNFNGRLDVNENDGEETFPNDNSDGVLDKGWLPLITVFSYEKNQSAEGTSRVNINTADEDTLEEELGDTLTDAEINAISDPREEEEFESVAGLLDLEGGGGRGGGGNVNISQEDLKQIIDKITVIDEDTRQGVININTAPEDVLRCLLPNNEEIVQNIIDYRSTLEGGFQNIGELLDVEGMNNNTFSNLANMVCTKSSVFSVRAIGYLPDSQTYKQIYAIIDRGESPPLIRYWKPVR